MTDLLLILAFVSFLALGTIAPFVFSLGYVWVDTFFPQFLGYGLLTTLPVSFIMGAAAFGSYLLLDRRDPPRLTVAHALFFVLAVWITLTNTWAVVPDAAGPKYDVAIKALLFAAFLPFVFRTRVQIEAFIQVMLFSATAHIIPWGIKTAVSGGGYGKSLGLLDSMQAWISESSTLSALCFGLIPLVLVVAKHNVLLPVTRYTRYGFYGLVALFGIAAIGTYARTALVSLAVMCAGFWWRSKSKLVFPILAAVLLAGLFSFTSDRWTERISTVSEYQNESSSAVRLYVWRWTWDYALQNPFGGGFNVFYINRIELPSPIPGEPPAVQTGRAFHNIYFAVLGEHGFPGIALYLAIQGLILLALQRTRARLRGHPEHAWCYDMAGALQISLATFLAGANFIDVSFSSITWNLLSLGLCLTYYARKAVPDVKRPALAVQHRASQAAVPSRA